MMEEGLTQRQWQLSLQPLHWNYTTHFFPVCLWQPSFLSCCPFTGTQGACLWASESVHRSFKWIFWFPAAFHLTQSDGIPADFYSQVFWGHHFPVLVLHCVEPDVDCVPSLLRWVLSIWDILPNFQQPYMDADLAQLASLHLLPVSTCFFFISLVIELLFIWSSYVSPRWLF